MNKFKFSKNPPPHTTSCSGITTYKGGISTTSIVVVLFFFFIFSANMVAQTTCATSFPVPTTSPAVVIPYQTCIKFDDAITVIPTMLYHLPTYTANQGGNITGIIGKNVDSIGIGAFQNCNLIGYIDLPNVRKIDATVFSFPNPTKNTSLISVYLPKLESIYGSTTFGDCLALTEINLPMCRYISGSMALSNLPNLRKLYLPSLVSITGMRAIVDCPNLEEIYLGDGPVVAATEGNFGSIMLVQPNGITAAQKANIKVYLPNIETFNRYKANSYWKDFTLISLVVAINVEGTGPHSGGNKEVTKTDVDNAISDVSTDRASVTDVILDNESEITSIGDEAFKGLTKLKSFIFHKGITNIGASAFEDCSSLTLIEFKGKIPPIMGASAFAGVCSPACKIIVPAGSLKAYQDAFMSIDPSCIPNIEEAQPHKTMHIKRINVKQGKLEIRPRE